MTEQMTLERVRDIMSDYIYPSTDYVNGLSQKMLQQWMDAIDAHLNAAKGEAVEVSPEFTVSARAAIAWVLWHHQGSSSPIGQPLRFALGMGAHEQLQDWRIREAKYWAEMTKATTAAFHTASPDVVRDAERYRWLRDKAGETFDGPYIAGKKNAPFSGEGWITGEHADTIVDAAMAALIR